jgi:hypothetical protein
MQSENNLCIHAIGTIMVATSHNKPLKNSRVSMFFTFPKTLYVKNNFQYSTFYSKSLYDVRQILFIKPFPIILRIHVR